MPDMDKMEQIASLLDELGQEYPEQKEQIDMMAGELQGLLGDGPEMSEEDMMAEESEFAMPEEDMEMAEEDEEMDDEELDKLLA